VNAPERDVDERFADWIDGRMSPRDRERFEAELRVNAALRARLDDYRNTVEAVRSALRAPLPRIDVADAVIERIASGAAGPSAVQRAPWRHASRRALWLSGSLAAAAALLIGVLLNWPPSPSTSQVANKPAAAATESDDVREQTKSVLADNEGVAEDLDRSTRRLAAQTPSAQAPKNAAEPGAAAAADRGAAEGEKAEFARDRQKKQEQKKQEEVDQSTLAATRSDQPERRAADGVPGAPATPSAAAPTAAPVGAPAQSPPIVTASTMLPQVMLQRRGGDAYAVPQGQTASATQARAFFTQQRADVDLATALPAATLQFRRLEALPPASTLAPMREMLKLRQGVDSERAAADSRKDQESQAGGEAEAWLIEGPGPEVYSYLARLSDVGQSSGYDVAIGEVPTREVELLLPAQPVAGFVSSPGNEHAVRDELRAKAEELSGARAAPLGRGNPRAETSQPGGGRRSDSKSADGKAGDSKSGDSKSAEVAKDQRAAKPKAETKERSNDKAPAAGATAPPADLVTITGTPEPSPVPVPDPMPAQARVVVIIERGKSR